MTTVASLRGTFEFFAQTGDPTGNVSASLVRGDPLVGRQGTALVPL